MLKRLALHLHSIKEERPSEQPRGRHVKMPGLPSKVALAILFANASLRRKLPDTSFALDGDFVPLGREGTFGGHHIFWCLNKASLHINAFNFCLGMLEKVVN